MAGKKFLNPLLKVLLCFFGTSLLGYYVYESFLTSPGLDGITIARILVLAGFVYLLIQSVRDFLKTRD